MGITNQYRTDFNGLFQRPDPALKKWAAQQDRIMSFRGAEKRSLRLLHRHRWPEGEGAMTSEKVISDFTFEVVEVAPGQLMVRCRAGDVSEERGPYPKVGVAVAELVSWLREFTDDMESNAAARGWWKGSDR